MVRLRSFQIPADYIKTLVYQSDVEDEEAVVAVAVNGRGTLKQGKRTVVCFVS